MAGRLGVERQQLIAAIVREQNTATVEELSTRLNVSEATIRRDLDKLTQEGIIQRAHGGAMALQQAEPEPPMLRRESEHAELKRRIGRAAADLIEDGDTVLIGSGSTTVEVARHLAGKRDLKVITNALNIANMLVSMPEITTILVGGVLRNSELSMIGHIAEQVLSELSANKVVMGIRALSAERGLTNELGMETSIDRLIVRSAPTLIIVADHSKLGRTASVTVAPASVIHTLVTDTQASPKVLAELRKQGVQIIQA
jgi:DeoR/GlpR family transcriptional regulator of sugar metabolism